MTGYRASLGRIAAAVCLAVALSAGTLDAVALAAEPANLKLLTWNIQMLPTALDFASTDLQKGQTLRAPWIVEHLNQCDYDVVVLQEVIDKKIAEQLCAGLKATYPHVVFAPAKLGLAGCSGGNLIVGRLPLKYVSHTVFKNITGVDKLAEKGCLVVETEIDGVHADHRRPPASRQRQDQRSRVRRDSRRRGSSCDAVGRAANPGGRHERSGGRAPVRPPAVDRRDGRISARRPQSLHRRRLQQLEQAEQATQAHRPRAAKSPRNEEHRGSPDHPTRTTASTRGAPWTWLTITASSPRFELPSNQLSPTVRNSMRRAPLVSFVLLVTMACASAACSQEASRFTPPDDVAFRTVNIMSEGTRLTAEVYAPKNPATEKLPTIIMAHGWGGVAAHLRPEAVAFARAGYLVVTFDYRGWGAATRAWC